MTLPSPPTMPQGEDRSSSSLCWSRHQWLQIDLDSCFGWRFCKGKGNSNDSNQRIPINNRNALVVVDPHPPPVEGSSTEETKDDTYEESPGKASQENLNQLHSYDEDKRITMIKEELSKLVAEAQEDLGEHMDAVAVQALETAALKVSYHKKYYNVMDDTFVYFPSVAATAINYDLMEAAEPFYYEEGDEFPLDYAAALREVAMAYVDTDMDLDYMERLAIDVIKEDGNIVEMEDIERQAEAAAEARQGEDEEAMLIHRGSSAPSNSSTTPKKKLSLHDIIKNIITRTKNEMDEIMKHHQSKYEEDDPDHCSDMMSVSDSFNSSMGEESTNSAMSTESAEEDVNVVIRDPNLPDIPVSLVGQCIVPFLADRRTFNHVSESCRELQDICRSVHVAPWPLGFLYVGNALWSVAMSPDGMFLAVGRADGRIQMWHRQRGPLEDLVGHLGRVYSIVFSPSGTIMATGSGDGVILLWSMNDFTSSRLNQNTPHVDCLAFSHDGKMLASAGDGTIRLWSIESKMCIKILTEDNRVVESLAFSPDGRTLASGNWGQTIHMWDLETYECYATLQESPCLHSIAYSPNGQYLASGSDSHAVKLWDLNTNTCKMMRGHTDSIWSVAFSPDGTTVASAGDDGAVRLWAIPAGHCLKVFDGNFGRSVYGVAFSPDGHLLASVSNDGFVKLASIRTL